MGHYVVKAFVHKSNIANIYNWNIVKSGIKHHKPKPSLTWVSTDINFPRV